MPDNEPKGSGVRYAAIGHEYRQNDAPSIAEAPDGSVWAAWLSFAGDRDDIAIRRSIHQRWSNIHGVPGHEWRFVAAAGRCGFQK